MLEKLRALFRRRRQSRQHQRQSAQQHLWLSGHSRVQLRRIQRPADETVHWLTCPCRILHQRRLGFAQRLQAPPVESLLIRHLPFIRFGLGGSRRRHFRHARVSGTLLDPFPQHRHLLRRELLLWRHLQVLVHIVHRLNEQTLLRLARHQRRPALATFLPAALRVQSQVALLLLLAVTLDAPLHEQRTDFGFKKAEVLRHRERGGHHQCGCGESLHFVVGILDEAGSHCSPMMRCSTKPLWGSNEPGFFPAKASTPSFQTTRLSRVTSKTCTAFRPAGW